MAIMTGKIQMRQGQEVNFDPDKMSPGEWAVSLDTKYIRMCFSPGVCIRMATYEAFEADMAQIKAILAEAKTVQSAVIRINNEVSNKLDAVVEYTGQAKTYRDQALQYRNDAERFRNEAQQVAGGNFLTPESAVSFTEATSRSNIITTDTVKIILGKIKKFFTDLKPHAFSSPTNNLLATVAGTSLDAVQGKVLYDRQNNLNIARKTGNQYNTLKEFVEDTGTEISVPNMGRFKDSGGFVKGNVDWYRYVIVYQNPYSAGSASSISGNGVLWDSSGNAYKLYIKGNKDSGLTATYEKLVTETALNDNYKLKSFTALGHIGISVDTVVNISTIFNAMPNNSVLTIGIADSNKDALFEKGIIPIKANGLVVFTKAGRGKIEYTPESYSDFYIKTVSNPNSTDVSNTSVYNQWVKFSGSKLSN